MLTRAYHHALNSSTIAPGEPVLDIVDIGLHFGGVTALKDVGFRVTQGHIHSVIGPNGAGKSSLLNCISGLYHPQEGSIHLHTASGAHELTAMQPHRIARLGVARSFQNIELFTHLTVLENLTLSPMWVGKSPKKEAEEKAMEQLHRVRIAEQVHALRRRGPRRSVVVEPGLEVL